MVDRVQCIFDRVDQNATGASATLRMKIYRTGASTNDDFHLHSFENIDGCAICWMIWDGINRWFSDSINTFVASIGFNKPSLISLIINELCQFIRAIVGSNVEPVAGKLPLFNDIVDPGRWLMNRLRWRLFGLESRPAVATTADAGSSR